MRRIAVAVAVATLLVGMVMAFSASAGGGDSTTLVARMNGEKEVSSDGQSGVGDDDGVGAARISLRSSEGRVCFRLSWANIAAPTAAHIHEGNSDEAGPVVVTLFSSESALPATISGVRGCASDVSQDTINAIKNDPAGHYVNVHNGDFPGGAIRGQLRRPR